MALICLMCIKQLNLENGKTCCLPHNVSYNLIEIDCIWKRVFYEENTFVVLSEDFLTLWNIYIFLSIFFGQIKHKVTSN